MKFDNGVKCEDWEKFENGGKFVTENQSKNISQAYKKIKNLTSKGFKFIK